MRVDRDRVLEAKNTKKAFRPFQNTHSGARCRPEQAFWSIYRLTCFPRSMNFAFGDSGGRKGSQTRFLEGSGARGRWPRGASGNLTKWFFPPKMFPTLR